MKLSKKVFNSLDAVIIAVFVLLFVFLAVKNISEVNWGTDSITVTLAAEKVPDNIIPEIKEGDKLYTADGELIGTVKRVYITQATETYADTRVDSGNRWPLVTVEVPDHSRISFTLDIDAVSDSRGYSVNGVNIKVNRHIEFYINGFSAEGYFTSVSEVKADEK